MSRAARSSKARPTAPSFLESLLLRPMPIVRLEFLRICAPLAILAFLSGRMIHAPHWIGSTGFQVPALPAGDYRQPVSIPGLPDGAAWLVSILLIVSGLSLAAGFRTRVNAGVFASLLVFVSLADRLAAFTVNKLGSAIAILLFFAPVGARFSVDAWLAKRRNPSHTPPTLVSAGYVYFAQGLFLALYTGSGICKMRGDWLSHPLVLFTHLHSSYQTPVAHAFANAMPTVGWTVMQVAALALETLSILWFSLRATRPYALLASLGMHFLIGVMFGPVVWFSLLMMVLVSAAFAPPWILERLLLLGNVPTSPSA